MASDYNLKDPGAFLKAIGVTPFSTEREGRKRGVTLAHNVRERNEVNEVLALAAASGGKIIKPAQDVIWGGHSGYFADPDGHLWEVCWNPHFPLADDRTVLVP